MAASLQSIKANCRKVCDCSVFFNLIRDEREGLSSEKTNWYLLSFENQMIEKPVSDFLSGSLWVGRRSKEDTDFEGSQRKHFAPQFYIRD